MGLTKYAYLCINQIVDEYQVSRYFVTRNEHRHRLEAVAVDLVMAAGVPDTDDLRKRWFPRAQVEQVVARYNRHHSRALFRDPAKDTQKNDTW